MTINGSEHITMQDSLGHKVNNRQKDIWCIETGKHWRGAESCAKEIGVPVQWIWDACNPNTARKTCNGLHFSYAENVNEVQNRMASEISKRNEKQSELEQKAALWDAYMAEQEAIRKANETREQAIAKAKAKVERRQRVVENADAKLQLAVSRLLEAERELEALENNA